MTRLTRTAALLVCATFAPALWAGPAERAVELNDEGERLFQEGRYAEAAERFEAGYALEPDPTFLHNLALTREKDGDYARAIDALERYREAAPDAPDIPAVEARIATLRELVDKLSAEPPPPPEPQVVVEVRREPSVIPPALPWVLMSAGAAGLVAGGVVGYLAETRHDDAVAEPVHQTAVGLQAEAERFAVGSTAAFVVGGVLAATGVSLGLVALFEDDEGATEVALAATPTGLALGGAF